MSFPKIQQTILDNNIKIMFVNIKNVKTVSVAVTIDTGYYEENENEIGLAHFLEHMIARHLRDGDMIEKIRKRGAIVNTNAYTSTFRTSYYAYGDSKFTKDIINLILDTYFYREINQDIFEQERTAVIVEMKQKMIRKDIVAQIKDLPILIFGKKTHLQSDPQKHINVVKKATDQDLINFMNKHYKPGKTTITVSGDFDKFKCLKIIKDKTKMLPRTPLIHQLKSRSMKPLKTGTFPKIKIVPDSSRKVTKILFTFIIFNSYEYQKKYHGKLLRNVLSRIGDRSILFDRLRSKLGVTYSPKADIDTTPYFGEFDFTMEVEPKNIEKALVELVKIINESKTQLYPKNLIDLAKSKTQLSIKDNLYDISPTNYLDYADNVINEEEIIDPQIAYNKYIKKTKLEDLRNIAKLMFKKSNCYLLLVGKSPLSTQKIKSILNKIN